MVRLPASAASGPDSESVICDNYDTCGEFVRYHTSYDRARVKGWHIFEGVGKDGVRVVYLLGPKCVGQRSRLPPAPEVLPGQEELF